MPSSRAVAKAAHTKTRTGCRTCRIRRVKCDEAKPNCSRCTSTGRNCDGYTDPNAVARRAWVVMTAAPSPQLALSPHTASGCLDDPASRSCFDFYRSVSAGELARFFGRAFWCQSLLRVAAHFPAVSAALVAVGRLHRHFRSGKLDVPTPAMMTDDFATGQYEKAVKLLIRAMSGSDRAEGRLISLMCGTLFAVFDVLRGNEIQALVHIDGVIKLLNEGSERTQGAEKLLCDIEEDLRPVISRFDVEAAIFSTRWAPALTLPTLPAGNGDPGLLSLNRAADGLHALMAHLAHFTRTTADYYRYDRAGDLPLDVLLHQQQLVTHFGRWRTTYIHHLQNGLHSSDDCLLTALLDIHFATSWITLQCCLYVEEISYDMHMEDFERVLHLSELLLNSSEGKASMSANLGIIYPLYWTALRCRDGALRRSALALLKKSPREGVWIPEKQASVAERVVEIEEGLAPGSLRLATAALPRCNDVLEFQRTHAVCLDEDKANRRVLMTYDTRPNGPDGEWEMRQEWVSY